MVMTVQGGRATDPIAFADAWASTTQSTATPIPDLLRGMEAVVVGIVTRDGWLRDANRGFLLLMTRHGVATGSGDLRSLFVSPLFAELAERPNDRFEGTLYRGLLSFGEGGRKVTSLRGAIYGHDDDYLIVAEHDIIALETLRTTLLEAQDELVEKQRHIAHLEHRLSRLQELADAAMRDRDTLLDALAQRSPPGT